MAHPRTRTAARSKHNSARTLPPAVFYIIRSIDATTVRCQKTVAAGPLADPHAYAEAVFMLPELAATRIEMLELYQVSSEFIAAHGDKA